MNQTPNTHETNTNPKRTSVCPRTARAMCTPSRRGSRRPRRRPRRRRRPERHRWRRTRAPGRARRPRKPCRPETRRRPRRRRPRRGSWPSTALPSSLTSFFACSRRREAGRSLGASKFVAVDAGGDAFDG
ncbi:hypothetical protein BRADI_2g51688v3 [Brachypodium distachyon]|uniref:Uncharacterized protein n=1 Tax=Brachypodium distachyon TaxID=15368 RepID=A0A0Q3GG36_BRADI|nr:hypothetical protein BRADI_2g51688v3 [Brachypodium distachyon]